MSEHLISAVVLCAPVNIAECEADAVTQNDETIVNVTLNGKKLYENINYTVNVNEDGEIIVCGINNYSGEVTVKTSVQKISAFQKIVSFFSLLIEKIRTLLGINS